MGTPQFRSLVRRAALDAHRSAFDAHRDQVTFRIHDAVLLVADLVRRVRPSAADQLPVRAVVRVAKVKGGIDGFMLALAERADQAGEARWIAFALAAVFALGALLVTDSRRASLLRLGVALAIVGALVALACVVLPGLVAGGVGALDRDAVEAAVGVWLDPVVAWALAAAVAGLVVALAAASVVRPVPVVALARRARAAVVAPPRNRTEQVLRLIVAIALGAAMVLWPRTVLTVVIVTAGALVLAAATAELLALAAGQPRPTPRRERRGPGRRGVRVGAVALAALLAVAAVAVLATAKARAPSASDAATATRSSATAASTRSRSWGPTTRWRPPTSRDGSSRRQDVGIPRQLQDGVRALMIDTHYGVAARRGVVTRLSRENSKRTRLVDEVGERFVSTAERLRRRIGRNPRGERQVFLCHTLCEVGATRALDALRAVHRFLVRHPEEIVILSIQDETSAADTAAAIRASGLVDEVYLGDADRPWPTLRELVDRDERVIVLAENRPGGAPWIHHQPAVMQETPFLFQSVAALAAPDSCKPNRGGTARLAPARQPLGRHLARAAGHDRQARQRARLPCASRGRVSPGAGHAAQRGCGRLLPRRGRRPGSSTSSTASRRSPRQGAGGRARPRR